MLLLAVPSSSPMPAVDAIAPNDGSVRYAKIFRDHYGRVVRWLSVLGIPPGDVEDLAQEVFVIAHRRMNQLRPDASVTGWLLGISRRVAATARRTRRRAQAREAHAPQPPTAPDPEAVAIRSEAASLLQQFLDSLPAQQRLVFALYELDGSNATEIGQLLELSPNTVHSRIRLIRQKLNRFVAREQSRKQTTRG